jgi:hypothetical protein
MNFVIGTCQSNDFIVDRGIQPQRFAMPDVFRSMDSSARTAWAPHYLAYLREREGQPDLVGRTLPKREEFFRGVDATPVPLPGPLVAQATFERNVNRRGPEAGLDERTLWALAVAKANRAERYGIEFKLRTKGFEAKGADDPYTFVEIQELYHTRIFISLLKTIGIEADILPPTGLTRMVVVAAGGLPHPISDVIALAAELAGVAAFRLLLDEARRLFTDEPAVLARIELLFGQILVDEVGHVRFLRSRLGPVRLAIARALLPLVTRGMLDDMPEMLALLGRERYLAAVYAADLDGATAAYPDRVPELALA